MYKAIDFVRRSLAHAKRETIPENAVLPLERQRCGTEPWQYLFGSVRVVTNDGTLNRYYENHYKKQMTRARFDALTAHWPRDGYATDCQGLLDAWLTYDMGEKTDINADMNYRLWCGRKGTISEIMEPFTIGEAVFRRGTGGKMDHVGWICGFMPDGAPLVLEARGIAYGVVVTRLDRRNFTHRGLMTAKFTYEDDGKENGMETVRYEKTVPMAVGDAYLAMQRALNEGGYRDAEGNALAEDGKWGEKSCFAFRAMLERHRDMLETAGETAPDEAAPDESGPNETAADESASDGVVIRTLGVEITVRAAV